MTLQPKSSDVKQYTFTKEILNDPLTGNSRKHLRLYKLIDNNGNTAAQFFYYAKEQFIEIDGKKIAVSVIEKFLKKPQYLLIDSANNQLGEYTFIDSEMRLFWQDVPAEPNGTITLGEAVYNFRRIPAGIPSGGYFKFMLYDIYGDTYADYTLKVDQLTWWQRFNTNYQLFNGTIETNTSNIMIVVSAFYLMERVFETLDDTDS